MTDQNDDIGHASDDNTYELIVRPTVGDSRSDRILNRQAPLENARRLIRDRASSEGETILRHWRGEFYIWNNHYYRRLEEQTVKNGVWKFLDTMFTLGNKDPAGQFPILPFNPQPVDVAKTIEALKPLSAVSPSAEPPTWLVPGEWCSPSDIIAFTNCLYHWPSRTEMSLNLHLFNTTAVGIDYNRHAPVPSNWFAFLKQLWGDDQQSIVTLQEWMGYLLTADTRFQKILALIGAPRGGKGTILKVMQGLLGTANYTSSTASDFAGDFGVQSAIDKLAIFFPDMMMKGLRSDTQAVIAGRFKSISGEDAVNAKRKHVSDWIGRLPARIVIAANETISITDASGVLASRIILLKFNVSFLARENPRLFEDKLRPELQGIANWALEGLARLHARGYFLQPDDGKDDLASIGRLGSHVTAFVDDRCELDTGGEVLKDALYAEWEDWCRQNNLANAGTKDQFARDLRSAFGQRVGTKRTGSGRDVTVRQHFFTGIRVVSRS